MYFETLCIVQGIPLRLPFHQWRIDSTLAACGGSETTPSLAQLLAQHDLSLHRERTRCRAVYDHDGFNQIVFSPYEPRPIATLQLLEAPGLRYARKSTDRSALDHCYALRGEASDVLLVQGNRLTDTTTANIALFDGFHWHTPTMPLLPGTHRAALLAEGLLRESVIHPSDLPQFSRLRLINAMLEWGELDISTLDILPLHQP